jgi:hypothetical protein
VLADFATMYRSCISVHIQCKMSTEVQELYTITTQRAQLLQACDLNVAIFV